MIGGRNTRTLAFGLALVAAAGLARAEETVESPLYKQWAKFKPGTFVTYKQVTEVADQKMAGEATYTLLEVAPEQVVIEIKSSMTMPDGKKLDTPPQKMPYPAKIPKSEAPPEATKEEKPDPAKPKITEGTDEVEVSGKKYKCKTTATEMKQGDQTMVSKTWMSDDIPGGLLKMETTGPGMSVKQTISAITIK